MLDSIGATRTEDSGRMSSNIEMIGGSIVQHYVEDVIVLDK